MRSGSRNRASGYIGSRVVEDLMQQGYEVHACVRDKSNGKKLIISQPEWSRA
ncbi:MAG: hypothetical protein Ct9H300mP20_17400 [Gammaproteobacteria bacterium]|nr:MAG: hypothetical protein Ct9H300mP20_17400 [Gammaproteobacteria bacterium]